MPWPALLPYTDTIDPSQISNLGSVTLRGDLRSFNWDGGSDLGSGYDTEATEGFLLDASEGAQQISGDFFVGGTIQFFNRASADDEDHWLVDRSSADNFRVRFHDEGGPTTVNRMVLNDNGSMQFYDESGTETLGYNTTADEWLFGAPVDLNGNNLLGVAGVYDDNDLLRVHLTTASIRLRDPDGTLRFEVSADGNINLLSDAEVVVFQWDQSQGVLQANDGQTGQVTVFPKGTLIDMDRSQNLTPSSWNTTQSVEHSVTVPCDYANQPVYVQFSCRARLANPPSGLVARIQGGIGGATVGLQVRESVPTVTGSVTNHSGSTGTGGDNVDIDGSTSESTSNPSVLAHSHSSGSLAVNGTHTHDKGHGHADTFDIDQDYLEMQWPTEAFKVTANGSGNIVLELYGWLDSGSITPDQVEISYAVWRR